jgi:hypothetical protein
MERSEIRGDLAARRNADAQMRGPRSGGSLIWLTTIDHSLTRPWTVTRKIGRVKTERPVWNEAVCAEGNNHVGIAGETYFMSGDGYLMPTRKGQAPPDLRYFKQSQH